MHPLHQRVDGALFGGMLSEALRQYFPQHQLGAHHDDDHAAWEYTIRVPRAGTDRWAVKREVISDILFYGLQVEAPVLAQLVAKRIHEDYHGTP